MMGGVVGRAAAWLGDTLVLVHRDFLSRFYAVSFILILALLSKHRQPLSLRFGLEDKVVRPCYLHRGRRVK